MTKLEKRFMSKVNKTDACWIWTGSKNSHGYGRIRVSGRLLIASVVAWDMHFKRKRGQLVLHKCDNPICVNPSHLFLGTQSENLIDCVCMEVSPGNFRRRVG